MLRPRARRIGFSLIELLVSTGIIAILLALLLPAVQQAREAARRSTCKGNLKQLGVAIHGFHDTHGRLPPGIAYGVEDLSTPVLDDDYGRRAFTWAAYILPQLEQSNVFEPISGELAVGRILDGRQICLAVTDTDDDTRLITVDRVRDALRTDVRVLRCPSGLGPTRSRTTGIGLVHYAATMGDGGTGELNWDRQAMFPREGFVVRFDDVTDGLANTLAIGEANNRNLDGNPAPYAADNDYAPRLFQDKNEVTTNGVRWVRSNRRMNSHRNDVFRSTHTGGVQFLFGDGAVRFLSEKMNLFTFAALGTRANGEAMRP